MSRQSRMTRSTHFQLDEEEREFFAVVSQEVTSWADLCLSSKSRYGGDTPSALRQEFEFLNCISRLGKRFLVGLGALGPEVEELWELEVLFAAGLAFELSLE